MRRHLVETMQVLEGLGGVTHDEVVIMLSWNINLRCCSTTWWPQSLSEKPGADGIC